MFKKILGAAVVLGGILVAKPVFAQDYQPQIVTVTAGQVEAAACYTVDPMTPVAQAQAAAVEQGPKIFLPFVGVAGPMCVDPKQWAGVVGLGTPDRSILGAGQNFLANLNLTNLPKAPMAYNLVTSGIIDMGPGKAVSGTAGGFKTVKVYAIKKPAVMAATDSPVNLEDELWLNRLGWWKRGVDQGLNNPEEETDDTTELRTVPLTTAPYATLRTLCPGWPQPRIVFKMEEFRPMIENGRIVPWLRVQWGSTAKANCPALVPFVWIKFKDFWNDLPAQARATIDQDIKMNTRVYPATITVEDNPLVGGLMIPKTSTSMASPIYWNDQTVAVAIILDAVADYWFLAVLLAP